VVASATTLPAEPTPEAAIRTVGLEDEALDAGTYRFELDERVLGVGPLPAALITVPDGWSAGGPFISRDRAGDSVVTVSFWNVNQVYGHPCRWRGTLFDPGPTVDDLAEALSDVPLRNATEPVDVTLGGYSGKYLEWSVPADIDFADCDADAGVHYFESWTGTGLATDRYQWGPGQVDRLWILDIDGVRLVIDAMEKPHATDEEREEIAAVVESIRFER
jgi:hypothetical protein